VVDVLRNSARRVRNLSTPLFFFRIYMLTIFECNRWQTRWLNRLKKKSETRSCILSEQALI